MVRAAMTPSLWCVGGYSPVVPTSTPTHRGAGGFPRRVVDPSLVQTSERVAELRPPRTLREFSGPHFHHRSRLGKPHPVEHPRLDERTVAPGPVAARNTAVTCGHLGFQQHL